MAFFDGRISLRMFFSCFINFLALHLVIKLQEVFYVLFYNTYTPDAEVCSCILHLERYVKFA